MKTTLVVAVTLSATLSLTLFAQPSYTAARLSAGGPPGLQPLALGGGQAVLELSIDTRGSVVNVRTLRSTPPYTQMLLDSVGGWSFAPATDDPIGKDGKPEGRRNVPSKVIVAARYRAPALQGPTQGEPPRDVAAPSADVAFPALTAEPAFPADAQFGGVVMIEALVSPAGAVTVARVIKSALPFDRPAPPTLLGS